VTTAPAAGPTNHSTVRFRCKRCAAKVAHHSNAGTTLGALVAKDQSKELQIEA
jgi:hypothetical protein